MLDVKVKGGDAEETTFFCLPPHPLAQARLLLPLVRLPVRQVLPGLFFILRTR